MSSKRTTGVTLDVQPGSRGRRSAAPKIVLTSLVLSLLPLASCGDQSPTAVMAPRSDATVASRQRIADLTVVASTETTLTIQWTQIDDGTGEPAWYRVKYARPPIDWRDANIGCEQAIRGAEIGAPLSCTIQGLDQETDYEVQAMSYRTVNGRWTGAQYSNVASGQTASRATSVQDLAVMAATESALTAEWTQVDDGTGDPANYRVKYAAPPIDWKVAEVGCESTITGDEIGARMTCTIEDLEPSTDYELQLMSYRLENGSWRGAVYSNVAAGRTEGVAAGAPLRPVQDLQVTATTESTATVEWTQVDDGTGGPGVYELKYATSPIEWTSALEACGGAMPGDEVGRTMSCTVTGLSPETAYDLQLMTYRVENGTAVADRLSNIANGVTDPAPSTPGTIVADLRITTTSSSAVSLEWTQVDDGTGSPALYRLKYAVPPIDWSNATIGCDPTIQGTAIGAPMSCTVTGLDPATTYDLQLMSYRTLDGVWADAEYSNITTATTRDIVPSGQTSSGGIWISRHELLQRPTSGAVWDTLLSDASGAPGRADIADMHSNHDVYTLAAALVCARIGQYCAKARQGVLDAIGTENGGRWISVGRNLASYVIAADLLELRADGVSSSAGTRVEEWIEGWLTKRLEDNLTSTLRDFGPFHGSANAAAQEGLAYAAVAAYLQDGWALQRAWDAFRTFACDPTAPDREGIYLDRSVLDGWAHDDANPCAINPAGTTKRVPSGLPGAGSVRRVDGALTGDMRRGGVYQWEPGYTQYPWVGLEGFIPAAVLLERAGYPAFEVADRAVLRTQEYLWHLRTETGDARWFDGSRARELVHLVNVRYGVSFPVNQAVAGGRTVGYTQWSHATW